MCSLEFYNCDEAKKTRIPTKWPEKFDDMCTDGRTDGQTEMVKIIFVPLSLTFK